MRISITREVFTMPRRSLPVPPVTILLMMMLLHGAAAAADKSPSDGRAADEAAIRAGAKAFTEAFARGDARAIAAMWTDSGTLADESGQIFKGRKAIEEQYAALFKAEPK